MPTLTFPQVCQLARDHGNGAPPSLLAALANFESGLRTDVPSGDGLGTGLMQITIKFHPSVNLNDPAVAMDVGSTILISNFFTLNHIRAGIALGTHASLYPWDVEEYTRRALAGYNAGAGNVEAWDKRGLTYLDFPVTVPYTRGIWGGFGNAVCG